MAIKHLPILNLQINEYTFRNILALLGCTAFIVSLTKRLDLFYLHDKFRVIKYKTVVNSLLILRTSWSQY